MESLRMRPCPFCQGKAGLYVCDAEGNIHSDDYIDDPWSGLSFRIRHTEEDDKTGMCPITAAPGEGVGMWYYDTAEEAIQSWNGSYQQNE